MSVEDEVAAAACELVDAFGAHDTARYFAGFAPGATFVFHTEPDVLWAREAYERRWREWEADGFRVEGCESVAGRVQVLGPDTGIWVHQVRTRLAGVDTVQHERETIVFTRTGGRWLAVHEHLSPDPHPEQQ